MNDKDLQTHQGGCLCGAVRYEVKGPSLVVAHCHCDACQRASGAGHSTGAMFSLEGFQLMGDVKEYKYEADNGHEVTRAFCPTCGSPIFGKNSGMEGYLTITLGTVDDATEFEAQVVVFARNQNSWDIMDQNLPTFEAQPNWKPGDEV